MNIEIRQKQERIKYLWNVLREHIQGRIMERNMNKLRKRVSIIQARGWMKDRGIKRIIDQIDFVDESRRKCLFKLNSEIYCVWSYLQIAFKW